MTFPEAQLLMYVCFLNTLDCDLQHAQGDVESALLATVTCSIPTACASRRHYIPPKGTRANKVDTARDASPFGCSRYIMPRCTMTICSRVLSWEVANGLRDFRHWRATLALHTQQHNCAAILIIAVRCT